MKIEIDPIKSAKYLSVILMVAGIALFVVPRVIDKVTDGIWSMMQPPVAIINTNALLTEKSNSIKQRLIEAKTDDDRQKVLSELNAFGELLNQWLDKRVPEICGKNCLVLDERMVIRGAKVDLTQAFRDESDELQAERVLKKGGK
jgi:transcriptional regulator of heat shock response